jgi:hypothetical protein
MTVGNLRESSSTLMFNVWSDYTQNSPGVPFPIAAPERGKIVVVKPCEGLCSDFISFLHLCIHTYCPCRFTLF